MPFGWGGSDSEDEKKKKKQEKMEAEALEEKKRRQAARRQRKGKKPDDPDSEDTEEEDDKKPGGRRPGGRRPGAGKDEPLDDDEEKKKGGRRRPGKKEGEPDTDEEEEAKRPGGRRPGRHGDKDEEEEEPAARPGRPGRHGKKDEDEDEPAARPGRPGRHGKNDEEEDEPATHPGRPGRHGKKDEEEDEPDARPGRPGRHGKKDEEEDEPDARPGRPGRHGKKHEEEDEPAARPGRPGRHRKDDEEDEPDARPGRPGRHGKKDEEEDEPDARPGRPGRHGKEEDSPAHPERPGRPGHGRPGAAAGHGKQEHAPSHTTPMQVDHNNENAHGGGVGGHPDASEQAKIEAQRKKDEAERLRLQQEANNQPQQPQQPQHHAGGGGSSGGVVTVKEGESIQAALDAASPGTTINIEAGTYHEALKSRVDGTKQQPITINGPSSGPTAIIKGSDKSGTCVEINHDYYVLNDFTIDGMIKEHCNKNNVREAFREKCLAIRGNRPHRTHKKEDGGQYQTAVDGVVVKNMKIVNCGGEGIRLRYFVTNCVIFHNRITSTGCYDFKFGGDQGIKNGEGIYIGTSSKQWEKNLTGEQDICRWNRVYENYIDTHGNECVDVKEGAMDTVIETNYCTGQLDDDSAGIDSRASGTIIRYNKVVGCKGAGVRLGGHKVGNDQYGTACKVYCNILKDNEYGGIKVMVEGNQICQNTITGQGDKYKAFRGEASSSHEENTECPFDVKPPSQDIETTSWFQNCKP